MVSRTNLRLPAQTPDSDGDGLWDAYDVGTQWGELTVHYPGSAGATDPLVTDTDGDGLGDGFEVASQKPTDRATPIPTVTARRTARRSSARSATRPIPPTPIPTTTASRITRR